MEGDRFCSGPIPEPFHKEREKLRNDLYKVPSGPADQRISQYLRLYKEIEKVEKSGIEAMGGLANAKQQATKAAKEARISKTKTGANRLCQTRRGLYFRKLRLHDELYSLQRLGPD